MTAEEIIRERHELIKRSPKDKKRSTITALVLGAFLVVALGSFVYSLAEQTKLQKQIKSLQEQNLQKDSLLQRCNQELKKDH